MAELLLLLDGPNPKVCDLDKMISKLTKESLGLRSLTIYFHESTKLCELLTSSIALVRSNFPAEKSENNTLNQALQQIVGELLLFESRVMLILRSLNQDVIEPLEIFRDHYDNNCKEFIQEGQTIFREIDETRKKVMKDKDDYFKSAAQLEKTQSNLKKLIESPDSDQEMTTTVQSIKCIIKE